MGQTHPRTPDQWVHCAAMMIAHEGAYGIVTTLSHDYQVSRPTRYAWRDQALRALAAAFGPLRSPVVAPVIERHVLARWIQHAAIRGIQAATRNLPQQGISLATITAVLHEAGDRAITWMCIHSPPSTRDRALSQG